MIYTAEESSYENSGGPTLNPIDIMQFHVLLQDKMLNFMTQYIHMFLHVPGEDMIL